VHAVDHRVRRGDRQRSGAHDGGVVAGADEYPLRRWREALPQGGDEVELVRQGSRGTSPGWLNSKSII